jgi:hypothetical protein
MEPLFKTMVKYSWTDVHYANSFLPNEKPNIDNPNSWYVGIKTGPDNLDTCIIHCKTKDEVDKYRSPSGNSVNEAIVKAKKKYDEMILGIAHSSCRTSKINNFP